MAHTNKRTHHMTHIQNYKLYRIKDSLFSILYSISNRVEILLRQNLAIKCSIIFKVKIYQILNKF